MKNTQLNNEQANTLIDLVSDKICVERVLLRETPLKITYLAALTHLRNIRKVLIQEERANRIVEDWENFENAELYNFFVY